MATTNDYLVKGIGDDRQWVTTFQLLKNDGTTLYSVDQSGNQTTAGVDFSTSIAPALTAKVGGGQDVAATSTKAIQVFTTVTNANDSCTLPAATGSGAEYVISNQAAANSLQLFGLGSDTVNGAASGTGIAVAAKKQAFAIDYAAGKWLASVG